MPTGLPAICTAPNNPAIGMGNPFLLPIRTGIVKLALVKPIEEIVGGCTENSGMRGGAKVPSCSSGSETRPTGVFRPSVPLALYFTVSCLKSASTAGTRSAHITWAGNSTSLAPRAPIRNTFGGLPETSGFPSICSA